MTEQNSHMDVHKHVINRVTVPEAAKLLGITQSAVHKRIARDQIAWEKTKDGRVYVFLDSAEIVRDIVNDRSMDESKDALIAGLRDQIGAYKDQVEYLREELSRRSEEHAEESRRKDTIIMTMAQRIPELEPASEPGESSESASKEEQRGGGDEGGPKAEARPWWRFWG
jgi:predicted transcriptional regulator